MSGMTGTVNGQQLPSDQGAFQAHMRIGPDGRVLEGGDLTFAAGGSSGFGIPGGGQFTPLLPPENVHPGDTWDASFDEALPFGGQKLHVDSHSTFLRYESIHGVKAAVTQTEVSFPLNFRLSFRDLLGLMGASGQDTGLSPDSNPVIVYKGSASARGTGWLDSDKGELIKMAMAEHLDLTFAIQGLAPQDLTPGEPTSFQMTGDIKMSLDRA
jgi:hypothetical protein